ncbi:MAG: TonB-dependent receptor, partial [Verrucomicrobiae bacterium]|nr:TonB-dependent receptor [Verrucomicrobiae bacterium]
FLTGSNLDALTARRQEIRPEVNGLFRDANSKGYELRLTANITDNWRLTLNAAKVDRLVANYYHKAIDFLGLTRGDDGLLVQGVTQSQFPDPENEGGTLLGYVVSNPGAYTSDGVIAQYLALESQLPEGQNMSNTPEINGSIAQQLYNLVDNVNDQIQIQEKRWGLRPYRFNVFTAYDFTEGFLKGWSVGGGYRWNSPNIIGEENGIEYEGEPQTNADLFLRYRTASMKSFFGDGRWTFQLNVQNLFDDQTLIPDRLAGDGDVSYMVPGGRGLAYARFSIPDPREYRFTVTYDF